MKKEDQRSRLTKEIFRRTLISLLANENLNRVSVTELCKEAELSRATFYTHYTDIFDLYEKIEAEVYQQLKLFLTENDENASRLEKIVRYVGDHGQLFSILLSMDESDNFKRSIVQLARSVDYSDGKAAIEQSNIYAYLEDYSLHGSISVLLHWLGNGKKESPAVISELLTALQDYSGKEIQKIIHAS